MTLEIIAKAREIAKARTKGLKIYHDYQGKPSWGIRVVAQDSAFPDNPRYTVEMPRYSRTAERDCEFYVMSDRLIEALLDVALKAYALHDVLGDRTHAALKANEKYWRDELGAAFSKLHEVRLD